MSDQIDPGSLSNCREVLEALQQGYMALITGNRRLKVRHQEKWVEYHPGNATALLQLINAIYAQCDDVEGLLDLNLGRRVARGAPAYLRIRR